MVTATAIIIKRLNHIDVSLDFVGMTSLISLSMLKFSWNRFMVCHARDRSVSAWPNHIYVFGWPAPCQAIAFAYKI